MQRQRLGFAVPPRALLFGLLFGLPCAALPQPQTSVLEVPEATAGGRKTAKQLVLKASRLHYDGLELDDALASRLLDRYLQMLDPQRGFLLASDVAEFQRLRTELDDDLRDGEVTPAYEIFQRFQERRLARLSARIAAVEGDLSELRFDSDETLQLDRSESPWAASQAELDELWRKLLTNELLELRLGERTEEEQREILLRRYQNQLQRAQRTSGADVFEIFLNSFTHLLDPHSEYFAPRKAQDFDIAMSLSLQGIGALIGSDGAFVHVQRIIPGGPAERGGELRATDRIVGVAQGEGGEVVDVRGWRPDEAVELIRGPKGTLVRLEIVPADQPESSEPREVRVVRDEIQLEDQAAQSRVIEVERAGRSHRIGVIELPAFYLDFKANNAKDPEARSATRDVARLVEELAQQELDALVMDLRNNGGGSLQEAQELAGLFMGPGPVVQIRNASGQVQMLGDNRPALYAGPLAVLVNRLSASASEIFAAAVQDRGRGLILGGRTFGKGTVQQVVPLEEGQLKITQAKFYRVSGESTQHRGVLPDVPFPDLYDDDVIGESALEDALPWDSIEAGVAVPAGRLTDLLEELCRRHEARAATDPDFLYTAELLAFQKERRKQTKVLLNEDLRRSRRDEVEAELREINARRRAAKGEAPESAAALEGGETVENGVAQKEAAQSEAAPAEDEADTNTLDPQQEEADAYQRAACEVLIDLILSGATRSDGPPWIGSTAVGR